MSELDFSFADGTQWGAVVLGLQLGHRDKSRYQRDPEAIRCHETGFSPRDIYLGKREYTDDELGKLDGPGRDIVSFDYDWSSRTPKARLTKRQRAKLRRLRRRAKRKGEAFDEGQVVLEILNVSV